jgi:uncharacterized membrane protein
VLRALLGRRRGNLGIKLNRAIVVEETPAALYAYWRDFRNLPSVLTSLESVSVVGASRSHWVMKAPAGLCVEWDAEVINEQPERLIAWRSTPTSPIQHAGSVHFVPVADRATLLEVSIQYAPPAGEVGAALAALLGADPERQLDIGLQDFKAAMERRQSTSGTPADRC